MSKLKQFWDFDRGMIVESHLCKKSLCEILDILKKPKSTVSGVIMKCKRRGSETADTDRNRANCRTLDRTHDLRRGLNPLSS
ncbi:hypothetical protein TNCV_715481 [Trichonephila clavipes]|nr:hypothetical protein TNCV_715481 [Trichonephila clavipes]